MSGPPAHLLYELVVLADLLVTDLVAGDLQEHVVERGPTHADVVDDDAALAAVIDRFAYLKPALAMILVFIGSKIFVADLAVPSVAARMTRWQWRPFVLPRRRFWMRMLRMTSVPATGCVSTTSLN